MYVYTVQCPESSRTPVVNQNSFYAKVDFSPDVLLGFSCLEIFEKLEDICLFSNPRSDEMLLEYCNNVIGVIKIMKITGILSYTTLCEFYFMDE